MPVFADRMRDFTDQLRHSIENREVRRPPVQHVDHLLRLVEIEGASIVPAVFLGAETGHTAQIIQASEGITCGGLASIRVTSSLALCASWHGFAFHWRLRSAFRS